MYLKNIALILVLVLTFLMGKVKAQEIGEASYYSDAYQGKKTASGQLYDKNSYTAAHRTLPMGTIVKVTNLTNGLTVTLRVNDRGPHKPTRIIDVSRAGAEAIGLVRAGIAQVRVDVVKSPGETPGRTSSSNMGYSNPEVLIDIAGEAPQPEPEPIASGISLPNIKKGVAAPQPAQSRNAPQTVHSYGQAPSPAPTTNTRNLAPSANQRKANPATPSKENTKGMGLYKFVSYEIQQEGYGIQIGAFEDYRNVLEVTNKLMQNNVQDIMIHTRIVDGKDQFRMLIGPFNSRGSAEAYQSTLASMNMKGWILNLREL